MNGKSNKPGAGKSILGFILTFILIGTLLSCGIVLGLKTTVFRGSSVEDILENLNLYESATELIASEEVMGEQGAMMGKVAASLLSEELLQEVTNNIVGSVRAGAEVDLSPIKDLMVEEVDSAMEAAIDGIVQIVNATPEEINEETLAQNEELQALEEQMDFDVSGMILAFMEESYGSTSVSAEEFDAEALKEEIGAVMDEEIVPALDGMLDELIVEVNTAVNEGLAASEESSDQSLTEVINMCDEVFSTITMSTIMNVVIVLVLIGLELLLYKKYMNRGVRNVGIAALISGIFVALIGAAFNVAGSILAEMEGATTEVEIIIMTLVEENIGMVGGRILLFGVIFIIAAIACFVGAGILKKKMNTQPVIEEQIEMA